ncbi:non-ribosomal peptide synthetase [Streptomyces naphthomycinicus]|uniref:non-ribosomal peptide synthetase n=1 Tax=Streptomyces naphthomycinicus TaxID=2872625 RepID=UPI001CECE576|nr:non-ribosomal peptide synthetase [Streptomyces sp. TML10]
MPEETGGVDKALGALSPAKRALLTLELARRRAGTRTPGLPVLPRPDGPAPFPASPGQERLWFLHRLDEDSAAYLMPIAVRLTGPLDETALRGALARIVDRHEALRTGFDTDGPDQAVRQVVHPPGSLHPHIRTAETTRDELTAAIRALTPRGIDLARPPLLTATLLRVTDAAEPERVLVLWAHHIVLDGWSLGILVRDLTTAYAALAAGEETPPAAPSGPQYADFAAWQHDWLRGEQAQRHEEYWRTRLAGVTPLPLAAGPAQDRTTAGDAVPVPLGADLAERLRDVAEAERATPFMALVAGLSVLLAQWTGRDDLVIATAVAGRPRTELEGVVGFFVNTLPLRITVREELGFRALLRHVAEVCVTGFAHQDLPFDRIVRAQGGAGAGTALAQVMLSLRNVDLPPLTLGDVRAEIVEVPSGGAQAEMGLEFAPTADGGLSGWLEFSTDVLGHEQARQLASGLRTLLDAAARDPDRPVGTLPVLDPEHRHRLVERFSGAGTAAAPRSLPRWFESVVDAAPDAVAVDDRDRVLTYRELDAWANRLARHLLSLGIAPEDRVGVRMDRGLGLVAALLAVLKTGAVYVPLDPALPPARLERMAEAAGASVVLTDAEPAGLDRFPPDRLPAAPDPDQAAYVLFTSGSTGAPKGVVCTHGGLANRLADMIERHGFGPDERVLQKTPPGFDPSLTETLTPLLTGARLVVAAPGRHAEPRYLLGLIEEAGITSCDFVPSVLRVVLAESAVPARTKSLRRVFCGGEELSADLARTFARAVPSAELVNLYGPTEASVDASVHTVRPGHGGRIPIGRPLTGVELYVLDERMRPRPAGFPGELFIGGTQVARGYLAEPGKTAARFVPHPFRAGRRLYATGDLARWSPDGELEFLGRLDDQLKIRGSRIEPGEIEAVLRDHPAVADAAVVAARPDGPDAADREARLIGYLTRVPGHDEPAARDLTDFLRRRLPDVMVPAAFVWLDAFALTSAGKLDRRRLPAWEGPARDERPTTPPADSVEEVLTEVWADVLGTPRVGVDEEFHELGGHSLLATRAVAQINGLLRIDLPLRDFVRSATVRELARRVREVAARGGVDADRVCDTVLAVRDMPDEEVARLLRHEE